MNYTPSIKQDILGLILIFSSLNLYAQQEHSSFIFGHSLINHEFQINPTPSQETSIPHWLHFLSLEANNTFKVSGQYGFLSQHANLPPIAQWGFDFVQGAWDSDNVPFSEADFNSIIITPANFVQWQPPSVDYPMESISPLSATETIFNWCNNQEDGLDFYIYENWPDMGSYLSNGFPPSQEEWSSYNQYLNGDFHDWFLEYHDLLAAGFPNSCIRMIPVGTLISKLLNQVPYSDIPIEELYEDDAPHGRTSIYFLASLITYMAIYEEKAPNDYLVDQLVHPTIAQNYKTIVNAFWGDLAAFNFENGDSRVFCNQAITSSIDKLKDEIKLVIRPNPTTSRLFIENNFKAYFLEIRDLNGKIIIKQKAIETQAITVNTEKLTSGMYIVLGKDDLGKTLYVEKFLKQ